MVATKLEHSVMACQVAKSPRCSVSRRLRNDIGPDTGFSAEELSASQASQLMKVGHMTVASYITSLLTHIRERDGLIKAWVFLDEEAVMAQALGLDALPAEERGPLHGVAVGIKDIINVKDMPTRFGSKYHQHDGTSPVDAQVVSLLRSAGAVILGKTATTEFAATSQGGSCANPRDLRRTPGGSSSGSAAAVADYHCPISVGTQTGGSMIRPASFTGIFGLKTTWGLLSTEGVGKFSSTCDTLGFFTRNMEDILLLSRLFRLQTGLDDVPRALEPLRRRAAMIKSPVWSEAGPGTRQAWTQAEKLLKSAGVVVDNIELPEAFRRCYEWRQTIVSWEARAAFLPRYIRGKELLHKSVRSFVDDDKSPSPQELRAAYDGISLLRSQWDNIAQEYDFILTPSVPDDAPLGLDSTGSSVFCSMWTILHVPTLNVPGFSGKEGMPIGLTVTGCRYDDLRVIEAGRFLEGVFNARVVLLPVS